MIVCNYVLIIKYKRGKLRGQLGEINSQIGKRIMKARNNVGYTREGLATKIEISPKFLYEIEYGRKRFNVEILSRLSLALAVSCDYIVFGDEQIQNDEEIIKLFEENNDKKTIIKLVNRFEHNDVKRLKNILNMMVNINKIK